MSSTEKRVTPIEKVIQFMKDREYRTSEFFRMLDKDGSRNLTCDELAARMLVAISQRLRRVDLSLYQTGSDMPYLIAATVMTMGACQGHSSIASFLWQRDHVAWFLCYSKAPCYMSCHLSK